MKQKQKRHCTLARDVAALLLSDIESKMSYNLLRALLSGEHHKLLATQLNPMGYSDWQRFAMDYQAVSLLKRYPSLDVPIDRVSVAVEKFIGSEDRCSKTTVRFTNLLKTVDVATYQNLCKARSVVHKVLGKFSWDSALSYCDFGPGAALRVPRRLSHRVNKIGAKEPTVTGQCHTLLEAYKAFDPHLADAMSDAIVVDGSVATTVPKDARSDRMIAIEPLWNMFFQKGIGGLMRRKLLRVGVDLNDQTVNQRLAEEGSKTGLLATLDLSAASDSVSLGLVRFLLPDDWYDAVAITRSPYMRLPGGQDVFLKKVSSMGNGFTFDLESLIFYSLVKAAVPHGRPGHDIAVYGDDLIVPVDSVGLVMHLLDVSGFKVNPEKSFWTGPFRESCGKHYFAGRDVTPFYLSKEVNTIHDKLWLANGLRSAAFRLSGSSWGLNSVMKGAYDVTTSSVPGRIRRLSIPYGYGDNGLVRDFDECTPTPRASKSWVEGYTVPNFVRIEKSRRKEGPAALCYKLWASRKGMSMVGFSPVPHKPPRYSAVDPCGISSWASRDSVFDGSRRDLDEVSGRFKLDIIQTCFPQWPSLGPWM